MFTQFNGNHESESLIQNAPEFINDQQLALISRKNNIVQASRIAAATTRKTDLLTQCNGNHESESLIQNAPDFFINNQQLAPISRHDTIVQASRLAVVKSKKDRRGELLKRHSQDRIVGSKRSRNITNFTSI